MSAPRPPARPPAAGPASPVDAQAIQRRLAQADAYCKARGAQLTALRREVLELLLRRNGIAKAYDLQEDLQGRHGRVAPMTVYRALDFLLEQHLVHRVDAINGFVVCDIDQPEAPGQVHAMLLVCAHCGSVNEWHDDEALRALRGRLHGAFPGFREAAIEIKGVCARCLTAKSSSN